MKIADEWVLASAKSRWEKVRAQWTSDTTRPSPWEALTQFERDAYIEEDRAAILAFIEAAGKDGVGLMPREATDAMTGAGWQTEMDTWRASVDFDSAFPTKAAAAKLFALMFDAFTQEG